MNRIVYLPVNWQKTIQQLSDVVVSTQCYHQSFVSKHCVEDSDHWIVLYSSFGLKDLLSREQVYALACAIADCIYKNTNGKYKASLHEGQYFTELREFRLSPPLEDW